MTLHEEIATQCIAPLWTADFVYGVLVTTLKRPGKGRSAQGSNTRGWRYENRPRELERFDTFVGELVNNLHLGNLTAEAASQRIDVSGYGDFTGVAESLDQMIAFFAGYLTAGDNVWSEGWTPPRARESRFDTAKLVRSQPSAYCVIGRTANGAGAALDARWGGRCAIATQVRDAGGCDCLRQSRGLTSRSTAIPLQSARAPAVACGSFASSSR